MESTVDLAVDSVVDSFVDSVVYSGKHWGSADHWPLFTHVILLFPTSLNPGLQKYETTSFKLYDCELEWLPVETGCGPDHC